MEESAIFDSKSVFEDIKSDINDFKLLKVTANACVYRVAKCGKYFLKKTTKDNSEQQLQRLRREYELSVGCSLRILCTYLSMSRIQCLARVF